MILHSNYIVTCVCLCVFDPPGSRCRRPEALHAPAAPTVA